MCVSHYPGILGINYPATWSSVAVSIVIVKYTWNRGRTCKLCSKAHWSKPSSQNCTCLLDMSFYGPSWPKHKCPFKMKLFSNLYDLLLWNTRMLGIKQHWNPFYGNKCSQCFMITKEEHSTCNILSIFWECC